MATGGAAVLLAVATTLTFASTASAAPDAADKPVPTATGQEVPSDVTPMHCSAHAHSNRDGRANARLITADGVNERRYPHTGCGSNGLAYRTHTVDYHCWAYGDNVTRNGLVYETWTYLRNVTTGESGWVSDAYLAANSDGTNGSKIAC